MCNLGEVIARENMEKGQKKKNIEHVRNLMEKMAISLDKAMDLLDLSSVEKEELKKYFQA